MNPFLIVCIIFIFIFSVVFLIALLGLLCGSHAPLPAPKDSGKEGEDYVAELLTSLCKNEHDHLMNDIILYDPNLKSSCEIDHIFIGSRGVFVIETKNWGGEIYGDDEQEKWTQVLADGNVTHKKFSPVKQNKTHIRFVEKILYRRLTERVQIIGRIVFVQGNTYHIDSSYVCTPFELAHILETEGSDITPAEQDRAYRTLRSHLERYPITKEQHLQYIRSRHSNE